MGRDMWGGKKKSGSRVLETDRHLGARAHAVHHREQLVERVLVFIAPSAAQADRIEGRALRVERIERVGRGEKSRGVSESRERRERRESEERVALVGRVAKVDRVETIERAE